MHSKAKPPTRAEKKRMAAIVDLGCIACILRYRHVPQVAEVHHLLDGGRRRGHEATIPLCGWHHAGRTHGGRTTTAMISGFGPSLAMNAKAFHDTFGSDEELLARTNDLLAKLGR